MAEKKSAKKKGEAGKKHFSISFEIICGVFLALFAASLAVTDLMGGKYGDDEIIAHNEKSTAYQWFNSKGMKENLAEGQRDILQGLISTGSIEKKQIDGTKKVIADLDEKIKRYGKEKNEILLGSEKVGKANQVQAVDGKLGLVIGAKQWEDNAKLLGDLGDYYDRAVLFLQFCLVLGAVSLVLQTGRFKWVFFSVMMALGLIGSGISLYAYILSLNVPVLG
jgi:hypothetical protein